nr:immunoglobulin heavy chain junction region [Macaca mulatta]
CTRPVPADVW